MLNPDISMPQETQAAAAQLAQESKARSEQRAQGAVNNIIGQSLLEMFAAGYARALKDHNIQIEG